MLVQVVHCRNSDERGRHAIESRTATSCEGVSRFTQAPRSARTAPSSFAAVPPTRRASTSARGDKVPAGDATRLPPDAVQTPGVPREHPFGDYSRLALVQPSVVNGPAEHTP